MLKASSALPSEPGPYSRHVPALDGLRGLAILMVIAAHLFAGSAHGPITGTLQDIKDWGVHGVDLFFVLSGFLITGILHDSLGTPRFFRNFYARRALRIFPLYYGVLAVLFLLTPFLHLHWRGMQWVLIAYLQNTNVDIPLSHFTPGPGIWIDHFWSLAVEEQFYLVWPLLVFLLARRRRILGSAIFLSLAALTFRICFIMLGRDFNFINRSTLSRADSLLVGAVLALLLRGPAHDRVLRSATPIFCSSLALYFLLCFASMRHQALNSVVLALGYTLLAIASAALIVLCLRPGSLCSRLFARPALRFFGRYSYGIYVLHGVCLPILIGNFRHLFGALSPSKFLSVVGASVLSFAISILAAVLSYNLYEKPFLRLKRYFEYRKAPVSVAETVSS